jgi:hypothetical protein
MIELQQIRVLPGLGAISVANTGGTAKEEKKHRRRMPRVIVIFGEAKLTFRQREDWEADTF